MLLVVETLIQWRWTGELPLQGGALENPGIKRFFCVSFLNF